MSHHKASPDVSGTMRGDPRCSYCDGQIHQVPGGNGMTWVHSDSGAVAGFLSPDDYKPTHRSRRDGSEAMLVRRDKDHWGGDTIVLMNEDGGEWADFDADWERIPTLDFVNGQRVEITEAWLDSVRQDTALAFQWITTHMPTECAAALERFVATNPGQRGIEWWDALDMLRDHDAHLDILEPLVERTPGWGALHTYVTLTLIYSTKAFTTEWTDDMRYICMRATIENNSR